MPVVMICAAEMFFAQTFLLFSFPFLKTIDFKRKLNLQLFRLRSHK